ncbi:bifunctional 4-hydroxy-2-oxoglutarate aldolase/2-dehydro-3-deoxy-phosphogluconate aldolase [Candidatus Laterigemmans baculatus]|uniref:bifunctional 4-hydroxy-2-oxoglutarate aldolase/2-dehydro-3-deoxy-phosphogluconate aldolase n=1 Tax=Candidatus Laterigemmans baculatus TaxID=2770505 RepID=UPI0013D98A3C|nr:bifunctional 4-hydroxy-2-oxoglutarate aldolase/2-dehydro-3-deoxy-phosphogluconate aldolase [Candidatus Laterigemmans baculatus]
MPRSRLETLSLIESTGVVAVIRADNATQAVDVCRALRDGGVLAWEIAMTTPGALRAIEQVTETLGDEGIAGVGTVLDSETAVASIHAGAEFVFSPIVKPQVIEAAHRYDRVVVPGALTPTEIATAWEAGADIVKVFPANHFGPSYFKDIHGPLPHVRLTPTGGVDLETAPAWIKAGAVALGVGSSLVRKDLIRSGNWSELSRLAADYIRVVGEARQATP